VRPADPGGRFHQPPLAEALGYVLLAAAIDEDGAQGL
jgi:hypothetical protein